MIKIIKLYIFNKLRFSSQKAIYPLALFWEKWQFLLWTNWISWFKIVHFLCIYSLILSCNFIEHGHWHIGWCICICDSDRLNGCIAVSKKTGMVLIVFWYILRFAKTWKQDCIWLYLTAYWWPFHGSNPKFFILAFIAFCDQTLKMLCTKG